METAFLAAQSGLFLLLLIIFDRHRSPLFDSLIRFHEIEQHHLEWPSSQHLSPAPSLHFSSVADKASTHWGPISSLFFSLFPPISSFPSSSRHRRRQWGVKLICRRTTELKNWTELKMPINSPTQEEERERIGIPYGQYDDGGNKWGNSTCTCWCSRLSVSVCVADFLLQMGLLQ